MVEDREREYEIMQANNYNSTLSGERILTYLAEHRLKGDPNSRHHVVKILARQMVKLRPQEVRIRPLEERKEIKPILRYEVG